MIIDGKAIAADILARTKARAETLKRRPRLRAIVADFSAATQSYLKIKQAQADRAGIDMEIVPFQNGPAQLVPLLSAIQQSIAVADAILVQLPLPSDVDTKMTCDSIPLERDADVLSTAARAKFERGEAGALLPPVVGAIREILAFGKAEVKNKKAVVIGSGWLVGKPAATWLVQQGAEVTVLNSKSENFAAALLTADVIISGAGSPHLIKPEMIKEDVVLIDAGTSESGGALAGDADPACAVKCSLFTPVPGGVGPIAVAKLFENAVILAERARR